MKHSKQVEFTTVPLKTRPDFLFMLNVFFSLNNNIIKLYLVVPEVPNFNPKTCFWKYPISSSWYNFFSVNVLDFYRYFTTKNQNFKPEYLYKKLRYTNNL